MKGYIAYNLNARSRDEIINRFYPKFSKVVVHHITAAFNVSDKEPLPEKPKKVVVVGYACDEKIECVVVEIDGVKTRSDGKLFHITLSHSAEAKPVMSNDLLQRQGFEPCDHFEIEVTPTFNAF